MLSALNSRILVQGLFVELLHRIRHFVRPPGIVLALLGEFFNMCMHFTTIGMESRHWQVA